MPQMIPAETKKMAVKALFSRLGMFQSGTRVSPVRRLGIGEREDSYTYHMFMGEKQNAQTT
jgi:hypothetical protein